MNESQIIWLVVAAAVLVLILLTWKNFRDKKVLKPGDTDDVIQETRQEMEHDEK